jgi:hypothetical protein
MAAAGGGRNGLSSSDNPQMLMLSCASSANIAFEIFDKIFSQIVVKGQSNSRTPSTSHSDNKDLVDLKRLSSTQIESLINLSGHLRNVKVTSDKAAKAALGLSNSSSDDVKIICYNEIFALRKQLVRESKKNSLLRDLLVNELNRSEEIDVHLNEKTDELKSLQRAHNILKRKCLTIETEMEMIKSSLSSGTSIVSGSHNSHHSHQDTKRSRVERQSDASEFSVDSNYKAELDDDPNKPEVKPSLIGSFITKNFRGYGYFVGLVMSYRCPFYTVVYEDGDLEELERGSVLHLYVDDKNVKEEKKHLCRLVSEQIRLDQEG